MPDIALKRNAAIWYFAVCLSFRGPRPNKLFYSEVVGEYQTQLREAWNATSTIEIEVPAAENLTVTEDTLSVDLSDGRTISVPLAWYPRLTYASQSEQNNWRLVGKGYGIHWEDLDEDISVEGLLAGRPSGESQTSFKKWLASRASQVA